MSQSVLGSCKIVAFAATVNAARAQVFYGDTLGLKFVSEDPFAVVFDVNGTMLRIAIVQELLPAKHTVLGWEVPHIAAVVKDLQRAGVKLERYGFLNQDELGVWHAPSGAKVAWFKDPDGNILSVSQF